MIPFNPLNCIASALHPAGASVGLLDAFGEGVLSHGREMSLTTIAEMYAVTAQSAPFTTDFPTCLCPIHLTPHQVVTGDLSADCDECFRAESLRLLAERRESELHDLNELRRRVSRFLARRSNAGGIGRRV